MTNMISIQQFLRRPKTWRAVEVLATALLEQGHLSGEEARRAIEAAYGRRDVPRHRQPPAQ